LARRFERLASAVRVTDESLAPVDLDAPADFVAITGKVSQHRRMMIELAAEFRRRRRKRLTAARRQSF
jgi:hypothetical protein